MEEYDVIGKPLPRIDGRVKVTGTATYAGDLMLPGMLHGKLLRSPHSHAKIFNIDMPDDMPMKLQERAYTSPIWYTP